MDVLAITINKEVLYFYEKGCLLSSGQFTRGARLDCIGVSMLYFLLILKYNLFYIEHFQQRVLSPLYIVWLPVGGNADGNNGESNHCRFTY